MSPATAARLLRLYPAQWRLRYGAEFAALLEEYPLSLRTLFNVTSLALEAHMDALGSTEHRGGALAGRMWCAWMLAVAAGMALYGVVDDSPFVNAMHGNLFLRLCWQGLEAGSLIAAAALALGGVPLVWSAIRYAVHAHRRDILLRLALPCVAALVLIGWVAAVLAWTGGHWGASPWAVTASQPDWPAAGFRWITGSISACLLVLAAAATAASIRQALRRSEFRELCVALRGIKPGTESGAKPGTESRPEYRTELRMNPLRFAAWLAPAAVAGFVLMFVTVALWGIGASQIASQALHAHYGPLGLTSFATWLGSLVLFGYAAWLSISVAKQSRTLRQNCG
jgi:hypothetical protein